MTVDRVYVFSGSEYLRFDTALNGVLPVYPRDIASWWPGLFPSGIDAAVLWDPNKAYFFRGSEYCRYDVANDRTDAGYPKPIAGNWPNVGGSGFEAGIDAAVNWGNGKAYWFRGDQYIRLDAATKAMDPGYPLPIAGNWPDVEGSGFEHGIDAAVNYGNDKVYWFRGDQYIRMDGATKSMDPGYPRPIAGNWPGVWTSGVDAALEWPVVVPVTPTPPTRFVRRDAWNLLSQDPWDPVTQWYARAVQVMQSRPASDPTSWTYQAGIHGSYSAPPPGATWNDCQHASWYFLPWHRMYLYWFERIVRAAVVAAGGPSDFALPYWNYSRGAPANSLPPPFRTPTLPDGSANPLFLTGPRRTQAIADGTALRDRDTSTDAAMRTTQFVSNGGVGFGGPRSGRSHFDGGFGALEQQPHNVVHVAVGGNESGPCDEGLMIDPNCAALDPIFWLHHANIDRLWNHWLVSGGGRANPTDAAWLNERFVFADESGSTVSQTVANVLSGANQLNYEYDDLPGI